MTVAPEVRAARSDAETARIPTGAPRRARRPSNDDKPVEFWPTAAIREALETDELTVWQRIHAAMNEVLRLAIRYEGSTLSDGTYRNALNQSGGYQNHHRVYDRADQICPTCNRSQVIRIVQAQRSTFFCKQCQRKTSS